MRIISFYNDIDNSTYYSRCAKSLINQCESFGLDYFIVERNYGKTWIENVRAKPTFILEALNLFDEPFIFLDCDCSIKNLDFEINGNWGFMLRQDNNPCDFVHYIEPDGFTYTFVNKWINEINRIGKGSHSAFINIYSRLNYFIIPETAFELGLAENESKTNYLK